MLRCYYYRYYAKIPETDHKRSLHNIYILSRWVVWMRYLCVSGELVPFPQLDSILPSSGEHVVADILQAIEGIRRHCTV